MGQALQALAQQQPTPQPAEKSGGWSDWLPTIGSTIGAIGGGLLTAGLGGEFIGGAGGGALGEALKNKIQGKENTIANVGGQALLGGAGSLLGAGLGVAGKAIGVVGRGGAEAAGEVGAQAAARGAEGAGANLAQKAATSLIRPSATLSGDALEAGISLPKVFLENKAILGTDVKTMVPKINSLLSEQEARISAVSDANAGKVVPGKSIITALEDQKANLGKNLGNQDKINALNVLLDEAKAKYANGITVGDARDIIRNANMQFGKAIVQDAKGAVVSSAQKIEANALKDTLKSTYPDIADALKKEQGLIMLRQAVDSQAGKVVARDTLPTDLNPLHLPQGIASRTINSPKTLGKIADIGLRVAQPLSTGATAATQYLGQSGVHSVANSLSPAPANAIPDVTSAPNPTTGLGTTPPATPSTSGITPQSLQQAMEYDLQTTGGKNIANLTAIAKASGVSATGGSLSTADQARHDNIQTALTSLGAAQDNLVSAGGAKGLVGNLTNIPIIGQYINRTGKAYEDSKIETATQIAKAITGSSRVPAQMVQMYLHSLPDVTDTPELAQNRIDYLVHNILAQAKSFGYDDLVSQYGN